MGIIIDPKTKVHAIRIKRLKILQLTYSTVGMTMSSIWMSIIYNSLIS